MKPSELTQALEIVIQAKQPTFIWGPPGGGKSDIVGQTADRLALELQDVRALLLDPVDLRGLPHVNSDGRAHWATPVFLPHHGAGVFFLDELNAAPPLTQAACYQLVLDRKLGEYTLPDGWVVIAAGNREEDASLTHRMPSALRNRFVHLELETDLDDWCRWAVEHGIESAVLAFIRFRPDLLHDFSDRKARAFPTPRSWEFVSNITRHEPPPAVEHALVAGAVGTGAAVENMAFLRLYRELPSIDAILLDPVGTPVPDQPATLYAVSTALARRATETTMGRVVTYLDRLPVEYSVMSIRDAVARDKDLAITPEFLKWAIAHKDVVF